MHWVIRFLPIVIVLVAVNIIFMLRDVKKDETLGGSKEYFQRAYRELAPMSFEEKSSLALFAIATVLAFTRQFYQDLLPGLKPAYAFMTCAVIAFLIVNKKGERVMTWKSAQTKIIWDLLFIFAGGLAVGTLISSTGAAQNIGDALAAMGPTGGLMTVFVIITVTLLMSDVTSNTATAAVAIPIVISIIQGIGLNPLPWIYIASIGVNLSYMLPTSIRAIPVGYGLPPKYMLSEGWKMTILVIISMTAVAYVLLKFWPLFSVA